MKKLRTLLLATTLTVATVAWPRGHGAAAAAVAARSAVLQLSSALSYRHAFALHPGPSARLQPSGSACRLPRPGLAVGAGPARAIAARLPSLGAMPPAGGLAGGQGGAVKRKAPASASAAPRSRGAKRGKHSAAGEGGAVDEDPDDVALGAAEDEDEGAGAFSKRKASGYTAATDPETARHEAAALGIAEWKVKGALQLLAEGSTVPFIARYRKEATGAMDETQLRALLAGLERRQKVGDRRAAIVDRYASVLHPSCMYQASTCGACTRHANKACTRWRHAHMVSIHTCLTSFFARAVVLLLASAGHGHASV